ncbi:hypothetical protein BsWGS_28058 [Bradybaena similaris]
MDFIKGLEKAQGLGVTKEEFIRLWEAEMKIRCSERGGSIAQVSPKETREDCAGDQFGQPGKEELSQALYSRFQAVLDEHTQKQEHMWREVHNMNNQKTEEFRRQCEIICQHISNVVETQMNSLKVYFMHELEITKQNLGKMIDDLYNKYEVGALPSAVPLQTAKLSLKNESGNTHKSSVGFHGLKDDVQDNKLPSCSGSTAQKDTQQEKEQEDNLPDLEYDWHMVSLEETPLLKVENMSENKETCDENIHNFPLHLNEKTDLKSNVVVLTQTNETNKQGNLKDVNLAKPLTPPVSSAASLNNASTEATGNYAHTISDQIRLRRARGSSNINDMSASEDWENSSGHGSADHVRSKRKDPIRSDFFNHFDCHSFCIDDIATYRDSGLKCFSPFLYPGTQSWKARLCIGFDEVKQLKIRVCITEGESDKNDEWPIRITANGFIFHGNSKRYTQIWALHWVACHKPSAKEAIFPAKICLETSRGRYPNVTYDELVGKDYLANNKAILKWNIKAMKL